MRAVLTRVKQASVTIDGVQMGAIGQGYLVLLGIGPEDTRETAEKLAEKIVRLRVFEDEAGRMNRDISAVGGSILGVSQSTLYADLRSRRPGFSHSTNTSPPVSAISASHRSMAASVPTCKSPPSTTAR